MTARVAEWLPGSRRIDQDRRLHAGLGEGWFASTPRARATHPGPAPSELSS